jgi:hypothetical protein
MADPAREFMEDLTNWKVVGPIIKKYKLTEGPSVSSLAKQAKQKWQSLKKSAKQTFSKPQKKGK